MNLFETKVRFPGCPKICLAANLPAFENEQAMDEFHAKNGPGNLILKRWRCNACGLWHYWSQEAGPAGASSGTTRAHKHWDEIQARFKASEVSKTWTIAL